MSAPKPAILAPLTGDSARTRRSDPETSHAAADSISAFALEDREREVLAILDRAKRPLCAQQIEQQHLARVWAPGSTVTEYEGSSIRTALEQLVSADVVRAVGETRTRKGRRTKTFAVVADLPADVRAARLTIERHRRLAEKRARRQPQTPARGKTAA